MRKALVLAVVLAVVVLSGCSRTQPAPPQPPPCADDALRAVTFANPAGDTLDGYVAGTGSTGIVLANQLAMDQCSWQPYVHDLTDRGYRVLAFDFAEDSAGKGTVSEDVKAAAAYLRTSGVERVVLIGASRGGSAVLGAAPSIDPPVAAVVSLSGPASYRGAGALAATATLRVPVLYVAGRYDTGFASDAQQLYDQTPGDTKQLLIVDSDGHGEMFPLGNAKGSEEVNKAIFTFLDRYASS